MTNEYVLLSGAGALFVGVLIFLVRHAANSKKHPCKDDIVFRDVCDEKAKRLEDCIEGAIKRSNEQHKELKEDMRRGFTEVKELIKNGS
jgi:hypothetical protein